MTETRSKLIFFCGHLQSFDGYLINNSSKSLSTKCALVDYFQRHSKQILLVHYLMYMWNERYCTRQSFPFSILFYTSSMYKHIKIFLMLLCFLCTGNKDEFKHFGTHMHESNEILKSKQFWRCWIFPTIMLSQKVRARKANVKSSTFPRQQHREWTRQRGKKKWTRKWKTEHFSHNQAHSRRWKELYKDGLLDMAEWIK